MNAERAKKMKARKKKLKEGSEGGAFLFVKANETVRIRALPVDQNEELGMEIVSFYLGQDIKRVISPKTFDEPCAIHEKYMKLKDTNKELADTFKPKRMYVLPCLKYDDIKGTKVNSFGPKLALLTPGVYQTIVDYSLDAEHGDPSDPKEGFDLKWTRTGSSMTDTEYSVINCKSTPLNPKFNKIYDTAAMLRKEIPTYEQTKELIKKFLGDDSDRSKKGKETSSRGRKAPAPEQPKVSIVIKDGVRYRKTIQPDGTVTRVKLKGKSDL